MTLAARCSSRPRRGKLDLGPALAMHVRAHLLRHNLVDAGRPAEILAVGPTDLAGNSVGVGHLVLTRVLEAAPDLRRRFHLHAAEEGGGGAHEGGKRRTRQNRRAPEADLSK